MTSLVRIAAFCLTFIIMTFTALAEVNVADIMALLQNGDISGALSSGLTELLPSGDIAVLLQPGNSCMICTSFVQAIAYKIITQKVDVAKFLVDLAEKDNLKVLVSELGPVIIDGVTNHKTPEEMCVSASFCNGYEQCVLYSKNLRRLSELDTGILQLFVARFLSDNLRWVTDVDSDKFSGLSRDCNDFSSNIYPGRKVPGDLDDGVDYNCNGISGSDSWTGKSWQDTFCKDSGQTGIVVLGVDNAVSLNFNIAEAVFHGFDASKKIPSNDIPGLYKEMVNRNRCNKNDYQSIRFSDGDSANLDSLAASLARNQEKDHPVIVQYDLFGCNIKMSPPDFKKQTVEVLQYLDTSLPKGSHVMVRGLRYGEYIFDEMKDKTHPTGKPYPDWYDYLTCLGISPCSGWLHQKEAVRESTSVRVGELEEQIKNLMAEYTFQNFDIDYDENYYSGIIQQSRKLGITTESLFAWDGFHLSETGNKLADDYTWEFLETKHSDWLGPINQNNDAIDAQFGN